MGGIPQLKMLHVRFGSLLAAFWLSATGAWASGLPQCAGAPSGQTIKVSRVGKDGSLILQDGRVAVLEGIRLPKGLEDRAPEDVARQALSALGAAVAGKYVALAVSAPKEDRHGRLRAQIAVGGAWLQEALLREGLARVALMPSHPECAAKMYAAEAAARAAKRGLWVLPAYAVRSPDGLTRDRGTFQIVEGKVVSASVKGGRAYVNFSADWDNDFTVTIAPEDMKVFRARNVDPRNYAGKTVRVHGIIDWYHGPEIEPMGPESVEIVE